MQNLAKVLLEYDSIGERSGVNDFITGLSISFSLGAKDAEQGRFEVQFPYDGRTPVRESAVDSAYNCVYVGGYALNRIRRWAEDSDVLPTHARTK